MINRVLIRIKVVQLLYSYLLVENQFTLCSPAENPTKEKRFAYSLYIEALAMMVRVAEFVERRGGSHPLLETRFISRVKIDEKVKSARQMLFTPGSPLDAAAQRIADKVKESALYKKFIKEDDQASGDRIWAEIFNTFIIGDLQYAASFASRENFTLRGVDRMRTMMEETFSRFFTATDHLPDALATLEHSMRKARELYFRLLELPLAITRQRELDIDAARHKYIRKAEDLNPNLRFVENEFVALLSANHDLTEYLAANKVSWLPQDDLLIRSLLKAIMASDLYREYMEFPATDLTRDCEFWRDVYRQIIFVNPDFLEALEEKSVFWNDDLDIIGTFVGKTVRQFERNSPEGADIRLLPMFKDEEDARFGAELFSAVVKGKDRLLTLIDQTVDRSQWETERLAYMDVVVIMTALAEIINFPKIPLVVSYNEYVEIAKAYSTGRSGAFVNGFLRQIVDRLQTEGSLKK